MPFPKTLDELRATGYAFNGHGECRGCGDALDWYITPNGKKMPMNHMDKGTDPAVPHWTTCTERDSFRKD